MVDFTMPYLRDYLREHGAIDAQRDANSKPSCNDMSPAQGGAHVVNRWPTEVGWLVG